MPLHAGEHRAGWRRVPDRRYRAAGPYRFAGRRRAGGRHRPAGAHRPWAGRGGPDRLRLRLYGLVGVVVCAVVLPFAVASAGPSDDAAEAPAAVPLLARGGDGEAADEGRAAGAAGAGRRGTDADAGPASAGAEPHRSPLPAGPATAVRCGPELTSPEGVEAQTCVLAQGTRTGTRTWARTYYRNATGDPLEAVLSLLAPDGGSVRMRCAVGAEDAPGTCETPREPVRGRPAAYAAVAEFAGRAGYGPLLLRTGSNGGGGAADGGAGTRTGAGDADGGPGN
ncbi:hypothetical protein ACFW4Q_29990 [Streptomyces rochei]|uniref:hypothetical protein n=1 Tax=Streptomyces rochei TaxID=1928 RepID=UPI0036A8FCE0